MTDNATYLSQLHQLLNQQFDFAEIWTLCLDLNVDCESVASEGKPSLIQKLLLELVRNGRLSDLIPLAQQQHPLIEWPPVPDDFECAESLGDGDKVVPMNMNQSPIYGDKFIGDKIGRDKYVIGDIDMPGKLIQKVN